MLGVFFLSSVLYNAAEFSDSIYDHMTIYYKMALLTLPSVSGHVADVNIHLHSSSSLKGLCCCCFFFAEICFNDLFMSLFSFSPQITMTNCTVGWQMVTEYQMVYNFKNANKRVPLHIPLNPPPPPRVFFSWCFLLLYIFLILIIMSRDRPKISDEIYHRLSDSGSEDRPRLLPPSLAVVVVTVCCSSRGNARGREGWSADGPEVWRIKTVSSLIIALWMALSRI